MPHTHSPVTSIGGVLSRSGSHSIVALCVGVLGSDRSEMDSSGGERGAITDQDQGSINCVPTAPLFPAGCGVLRRGWRTVADAAKIKKVLVQKRINGTP